MFLGCDRFGVVSLVSTPSISCWGDVGAHSCCLGSLLGSGLCDLGESRSARELHSSHPRIEPACSRDDVSLSSICVSSFSLSPLNRKPIANPSHLFLLPRHHLRNASLLLFSLLCIAKQPRNLPLHLRNCYRILHSPRRLSNHRFRRILPLQSPSWLPREGSN